MSKYFDLLKSVSRSYMKCLNFSNFNPHKSILLAFFFVIVRFIQYFLTIKKEKIKEPFIYAFFSTINSTRFNIYSNNVLKDYMRIILRFKSFFPGKKMKDLSFIVTLIKVKLNHTIFLYKDFFTLHQRM